MVILSGPSYYFDNELVKKQHCSVVFLFLIMSKTTPARPLNLLNCRKTQIIEIHYHLHNSPNGGNECVGYMIRDNSPKYKFDI